MGIASSWINGADADTGGPTHHVIDPATGNAVADYALATPADVDAAVASARGALRGWATATPVERSAVLPTEATQPTPTRGRRPEIDELRGASATDESGNRIPPAVRSVLRRDLPWTLAIALLSSAVYVPTVYSTTWGTFKDYLTAFAAGFIGKVVVNWGALPLFQGVRGTANVSSEASGGEATT